MDIKLKVVSLWAEDIPKTAHFYRDVIGLRLMPHHGDRPHFDLSDQYMVLVKGKPATPNADSPDEFPVVAFSVDDFESAIEKLRNHNVDLPWGIEEGLATRWIRFYDPAGNLVELVEALS
jgi:catechol 2,3-dioxygenase-like lactoylglutathione lyase family enzyme